MNGGRGGSSGEGEIVIVIFWVGLIGGRGGGGTGGWLVGGSLERDFRRSRLAVLSLPCAVVPANFGLRISYPCR